MERLEAIKQKTANTRKIKEMCSGEIVQSILDIEYLIEQIESLKSKNERMQAELARYRETIADGRMVELPCEVGDDMFSFCWDREKEKYQVRAGKIKNVRYDSMDNSVTVSDGEQFCCLGKRAFLTREEAEKALEVHK